VSLTAIFVALLRRVQVNNQRSKRGKSSCDPCE